MRVATAYAVFALAAVASMGASDAAAQPASGAKTDGSTVAEVVVTGSLIARRDYVADTPITTVDQSAIASRGPATLEAALNQLPQVAFSASSNTNNSSRGGQASIDLRGLGQQRTLVLIDGRRMQPSSPDGSVDLNVIPSALVDNVEIITGGASSVYGSDAVTGVVNLKLRKHVNGVEVGAQYGETGRGDGATQDYNLLAGDDFGDGKGQAYLSLNWSKRDPAYFADRPYLLGQSIVSNLTYMAVGVAGANLPSQATVNAVFAKYGVPAGAVSRSTVLRANPDGTLFAAAGSTNFRGSITPPLYVYQGALQYAAGDDDAAQTYLNRYNMVGHVDYSLDSDTSVFFDGLFTHYRASTGADPANTGSTSGVPLNVPVSNPFIPADLATILASRPSPNAAFTISGFIDAFGRRQEYDDYYVYQLTTGAKGKLPVNDWTWSLYGSVGRTDYNVTEKGFPSSSALNALLSAPDGGRNLCSGGFNPFNLTTLSPACVSFVSRTAHNTTTLDQRLVDGTITGTLFEAPAGPLKFALGADYRYNSYAFSPDSLIVIHDLANFLPQNPSSGSQHEYEIYGELLVPVLRDLPLAEDVNLDLGYRLSDYNTSGDVSTYKVDANWAVTDSLRFRGGYSRATRAPSVGELFGRPTAAGGGIGAPGVTGQGDPCDVRGAYRSASSQTAAQVRALCLAEGVPSALIDTFNNINPGVPSVANGNPDLTPETADTYSFGVVLHPKFENPLFSNLSASVDYYDIKLKDVIGLITATLALDRCFNPVTNPGFANANTYCQLISRDPTSGQLTQIVTPELNLSNYETSGVDFQFDWHVGMDALGLDADWGTLSLNTVVSYLQSFKIQTITGAPTLDYAGTIGNAQIDPFADAHPTWKANTSLGWQVGTLQTSLRWRFIDAMANATNVGTTGSAPGVKSVNYFDLDGLWRVTPKVDLRAGVLNLFDKKPPTLNTNVTGLLASDPFTYDFVGRRFFVGVRARF